MIVLAILTLKHNVYSAIINIASDTYKQNFFTGNWDIIQSPISNLTGGNTNYADFSATANSTATITTSLNNLDISTRSITEGNATAYISINGNTQTKTGGLNVSGNVGVGTTNPLAKFDLLSPTANQLRVGYADGTDMRINVDSSGQVTFDPVLLGVPLYAGIGAATNGWAIGGTDIRAQLTVQHNNTQIFAANTDPGDAGRAFVMQNNNTADVANQYSAITLQSHATGSLPGGRVLGDIRLVRKSNNSSDSFFMLSSFMDSGYKDFARIGYDYNYFPANTGIGTTNPTSAFDVTNGSITVRGRNAGINVHGGVSVSSITLSSVTVDSGARFGSLAYRSDLGQLRFNTPAGWVSVSTQSVAWSSAIDSATTTFNSRLNNLDISTRSITEGNATAYINISGSTQTKTGSLILETGLRVGTSVQIGNSVNTKINLGVYGYIQGLGDSGFVTADNKVKLNLASTAAGGTASTADFIYSEGGVFRATEADVKGADDIFFQGVPNSGSGYTFLEGWGGLGLVLGTGNGTTPIIFQTNRVEKVRIDGGGNVGIGTTNPLNTLAVIGNVSISSANTNTVTSFTTKGQELLYLRTTTTAGENNYGGLLAFGDLAGTAHLGAGMAVKQTSSDDDQVGLAFFTHGSNNTNSTLNERMLINHSGNVGIGTTNPLGALDVLGGTFTVRSGGLVGIGTTNPTHKLEVAGNIQMTGLQYLQSDASNDLRLLSNLDNIYYHGNNHVWFNKVASTEYMRVNSSGSVGIGTTNPTQKFEVNGGSVTTNGAFIVSVSSQGFVQKSEDGTCWSARVHNNGSIYTIAITCP